MHMAIWAEDYLHHELKKKNALQESNSLNELVETFALLHANKEPVQLNTHNSKTNDGWTEENMTNTLEQTGNENQ